MFLQRALIVFILRLSL